MLDLLDNGKELMPWQDQSESQNGTPEKWHPSILIDFGSTTLVLDSQKRFHHQREACARPPTRTKRTLLAGAWSKPWPPGPGSPRHVAVFVIRTPLATSEPPQLDFRRPINPNPFSNFPIRIASKEASQ